MKYGWLILAALAASCGSDDDVVYVPSGAIGTGGSIGIPGGGEAADPDAVWDFAPGIHGSGVDEILLTKTGWTTVIDCDQRDRSGTTMPCDTGGTWTQVLGYGGGGGSTIATYAAPFTEASARAANFFRAVEAAPNTTTGDITTEDIWATVIVRAGNSGAAQYLFNKYDLGTTAGWAIRVTSGGTLQAVVNATAVGSYVLPTRQEWNLISFSCDRTGGANSFRVVVNGQSAGTGTCPTASATAVGKTAQIGGRSDAVADEINDGMVSNVMLWKCTDCLIGTSADDAMMALDHRKVMGISPTALLAADLVPGKATRDHAKHCDIIRDSDATGKAKFFNVGKNWLCVISRREQSRDGRIFAGYFSEPQRTNLALQSSVFGTTWTDLTVADSVTANEVAAPNYVFEADRVIAALDVVGLEHGMRQAITLEAAKTYVISVVTGFVTGDSLKYMYIRDSTIANAHSFFDVERCWLGTSYGAGLRDMGTANNGREAARRITWLGNETADYLWCKSEIVVDGTAASHNIDIGFSTADGTFTSTTTSGQRVGLIWYAQVEAMENSVLVGEPASSYIPTTTVSVARAPDELTYPIGWYSSSVGGMTAQSFMFPDSRIDAGTESYTANRNVSGAGCLIDTGTGITDYIFFASTGEAQGPSQYGFVGDIKTANVAQVTDIFPQGKHATRNGEMHYFRTVFFPNDVRTYIDGAVTPNQSDTSVTLPSVLTQMSVGFSDATNFEWTRGLLHRCAYYTTEWEAPPP